MMELTEQTYELLRVSITGLAVVFVVMITMNAISQTVIRFFSGD